MMAQFMSGAQHDPALGRAASYAMSRWTTEIEAVVGRVLQNSPLAEIADVGGLARALGAGFIGLELYEGVDADGMARAGVPRPAGTDRRSRERPRHRRPTSASIQAPKQATTDIKPTVTQSWVQFIE